jgi:5-methylcytosine-specific restriction endonuclease McrA
MKICSKCKVEKHETEFRIRKNRPCGLFSRCKACDLIYSRQYKRPLEVRLRDRQRSREYEKTLRGKQGRRRRCQSEKGRLYIQQYTRRRRELKLLLDFNFTQEDVKFIHSRFNRQCFNCGSADKLEIDHHYPLSKGFGLSVQNAVLLCKSCNTHKKDKFPEAFYTVDKLKVLSVLLARGNSIQSQSH